MNVFKRLGALARGREPGSKGKDQAKSENQQISKKQEVVVRLAKDDIKALASAITDSIHEKFRSPVFQFEVMYRLQYSQDSAAYVAENMHSAFKLSGKENHLRYVLRKVGSGLILEFGVFQGKSINLIADILPDRQIHGFDSFEGLPEAWTGYNMAAATFNRKGELPTVKKNVALHKGLFSETLAPFLAKHPDDVAFIHIDCDLYSSTKIVLDALAHRIKPGTVIAFDEYHNYPQWRDHEHKAFTEFCKSYGVAYDYISYTYLQAAVQIKTISVTAT
ncbi:MAG TPA: class I SAM-dependent methyltransferase [Rhizomicrobium sp.]